MIGVIGRKLAHKGINCVLPLLGLGNLHAMTLVILLQEHHGSLGMITCITENSLWDTICLKQLCQLVLGKIPLLRVLAGID